MVIPRSSQVCPFDGVSNIAIWIEATWLYQEAVVADTVRPALALFSVR